MIQSFADPETEAFHLKGVRPTAGWQSIGKIVARKLDMIDAAAVLDDLRSPPGNRLERLRGDRRGQYSIRVNVQWRVCFTWTPEGPRDVEVTEGLEWSV